jgi:hypothetical protein
MENRNQQLVISFLDAVSQQPIEVLIDTTGEDTYVVLGNKNQKYVIQLKNVSPEGKPMYVKISVDNAHFGTLLSENIAFTVRGLKRPGLDNALFVLQFLPTELQDKYEEHIKATPECCRIKIEAFWFVRFVEIPVPIADPAMSCSSTVGNNVHMPYRVKGYKPGISSISALGFETIYEEHDEEDIRDICHVSDAFFTATYRAEAKTSPQDEVIDLT